MSTTVTDFTLGEWFSENGLGPPAEQSYLEPARNAHSQHTPALLNHKHWGWVSTSTPSAPDAH